MGMMIVTPIETTTPRRVPPPSMIQRCGGRICPPGTCDHGREPSPTMARPKNEASVASLAPRPMSSHRLASMSTWPGRPQYRLEVTAPGDPSEREADGIADAVMRSVDPEIVTGRVGAVQRASDGGCPAGECPDEEADGHGMRSPESGARTTWGGRTVVHAEHYGTLHYDAESRSHVKRFHNVTKMPSTVTVATERGATIEAIVTEL